MLGLLITAAIAAKPPAPEPMEAWIAHNVQLIGWELVGHGSDAIAYVRPDADAMRSPRVWVRYESRTDQTWQGVKYRSVVQLQEVNCGDRSFWVRQGTLYRLNNMASPVGDAGVDGRTYVVPGTLGETVLSRVCEVRATARPKAEPSHDVDEVLFGPDIPK